MKIEIDPKELYERHAKDAFGTVSIFGYTGLQIVEALDFWEMSKMHVDFTREEAIKHKCHGISQPECLVQALEALGLIKFKEPEKETGLPIGFRFPFDKMKEWTECVNALINQGYLITKV